jgi:acetyl-CoA carboxylase carboxyl transferase subunit alpha
MRLMHMAENFSRPIITFIDTPGAYPGIGAEERGQSEAIARNLMQMVGLKVPIISIVIGEGGSGGALAIGVADRIMIFEYATYSVISPEGCAAILWKDGTKADLAASALKLSAKELKELGIVDRIIKEPLGGAHRNPEKAYKNLKANLTEALNELTRNPLETLLEARYNKYRGMGIFSDLFKK